MRKNYLFLSFSLSLFACILSCNTPDKLLVRQEGTWDILSHRTSHTRPGLVLFDTTETSGSILFMENLTGTWVSADSDSTAFNWYYNPERDQVTTMVLDSITGLWDPRIWDIRISTAKSQEWGSSFSRIIDASDSLTTIAETLKLKRRD